MYLDEFLPCFLAEWLAIFITNSAILNLNHFLETACLEIGGVIVDLFFNHFVLTEDDFLSQRTSDQLFYNMSFLESSHV